jgi:putative membrane protein
MKKLSIFIAMQLVIVSLALTAETSGNLSSADMHFINAASLGGKAEVELGRLAQERAKDSSVKEFGRRMVEDHSQINQELSGLASRKNITPTIDQREKQKADQTMDHLSKLSGAEFDRAYIDHMVKDHEKDAAEFKKMSRDANDSDLKNFSEKNLRTIESHLQSARNIQSSLKK